MRGTNAQTRSTALATKGAFVPSGWKKVLAAVFGFAVLQLLAACSGGSTPQSNGEIAVQPPAAESGSTNEADTAPQAQPEPGTAPQAQSQDAVGVVAGGPTDPFAGPQIGADSEFCRTVSEFNTAFELAQSAPSVDLVRQSAELAGAVADAMPEGAPSGQEIFSLFQRAANLAVLDGERAQALRDDGASEEELRALEASPEAAEAEAALGATTGFPVQAWIGWQCKLGMADFFDLGFSFNIEVPDPIVVQGFIGQTFTYEGAEGTITDAQLGWWRSFGSGGPDDELELTTDTVPRLYVEVKGDLVDGDAVHSILSSDGLELATAGHETVPGGAPRLGGTPEEEQPDELWFTFDYWPGDLSDAAITVLGGRGTVQRQPLVIRADDPSSASVGADQGALFAFDFTTSGTADQATGPLRLLNSVGDHRG